MAASLTARIRHGVLDVDLNVPLDASAPVTVVFGPSGAGKTTLLRCIAGLAAPGRDAHIQLGERIWHHGRQTVPARRRKIGYLFQDHSLFPNLSVTANVGYGIQHGDRATCDERILAALSAARAAHLIGFDTPGLSGGEAQRVALARALASDPQLLLLDEPFSALDLPTRDQLRTDLRQTLLDTGTPAVLVTHDRSEAWAIADRVVILIGGRVHQVGSVDEVFTRPATLEAAHAVGIENILPGRITRARGGTIDVAVGAITLTTPNPRGLVTGQQVAVCIRAENITLHDEGSTPEGGANWISARVADIADRGPLQQVRLDTQPAMTAYTLGSGAHSAQPGVAVTAHLAAEHCHTIAAD